MVVPFQISITNANPTYFSLCFCVTFYLAKTQNLQMVRIFG